MGVPLSPDMKKNVDKLKSEASEVFYLNMAILHWTFFVYLKPNFFDVFLCLKGETNECQSTPKKTSELAKSESKTAGVTAGGKEEDKTAGSSTTEQQKLEEISVKATADEGKDKTEASKESKAGKIDPSSKTRKSSKSPLLEKLLSPGRRSRRGQKDKTKTEKATDLPEDVAGGKTSKSEDTSKTATTIQVEKVTDSAKISEVEAKVDEAKSKEVKGSGGNEALSTVTGAFDVFKLGGKKSK